MGDVIEQLMRGNVAEVKVVLSSVAFALAAYQLVLAAVGYGRLRPSFLGPQRAFMTHRASGDTIAVLVVVVAVSCLRADVGDQRGDVPVSNQLLGSLIVALAIVAITIAIVTAKLGPNSGDDDGGRHGGDRQEQRED